MIFDSTIRRMMRPDQPDWLTALQNDLALLTASQATNLQSGPDMRGPSFNFRLEHIQQVERDAMRLVEEIKADQDIVLAGVWLHDRFKQQFESEEHAHKAAVWARENLAGLGFPQIKIETTAQAIARHSDPAGVIPASAVEARILWDADKLSRMGPLNIINYMLAHSAFPEQRISYTNLALLGLEKLDRARRMVEEFYYQRSREIALARYQQQKTFYEAFAQDVQV